MLNPALGFWHPSTVATISLSVLVLLVLVAAIILGIIARKRWVAIIAIILAATTILWPLLHLRTVSRPVPITTQSSVPTSAFFATLPSGITVELLGVSENPSDQHAWWKPDGSPLLVRPYSHLGAFSIPHRNEVAREFAVQLGHFPGDPIGTQWRFDPSGSSAGGGPPVEDGESLMNLRAMTVVVPAALPTLNVHFGVASGPWQTLGEFNGVGGQSMGQGDMAVVFAPAI